MVGAAREGSGPRGVDGGAQPSIDSGHDVRVLLVGGRDAERAPSVSSATALPVAGSTCATPVLSPCGLNQVRRGEPVTVEACHLVAGLIVRLSNFGADHGESDVCLTCIEVASEVARPGSLAMTCPALAMSMLPPGRWHQVGPLKRVAQGARGATSLPVAAVPHGVVHVLGVGSPVQVGQRVVRRVAVPVAGLRTLGFGSNECEQNQTVHGPSGAPPVAIQAHHGVAALRDRRSQDATPLRRPAALRRSSDLTRPRSLTS